MKQPLIRKEHLGPENGQRDLPETSALRQNADCGISAIRNTEIDQLRRPMHCWRSTTR